MLWSGQESTHNNNINTTEQLKMFVIRRSVIKDANRDSDIIIFLFNLRVFGIRTRIHPIDSSIFRSHELQLLTVHPSRIFRRRLHGNYDHLSPSPGFIWHLKLPIIHLPRRSTPWKTPKTSPQKHFPPPASSPSVTAGGEKQHTGGTLFKWAGGGTSLIIITYILFILLL